MTKQSRKWGGSGKGESYAAGAACADLVGQTILVARVSHEDSRFDHVLRGSADGNGCVGNPRGGIAAAAEGVVEDLTTLSFISVPSSNTAMEGLDGYSHT